MKRACCLLVMLLFIVTAFSQTTPIKIDENTVVKDSSGNILSYAIWRALLLKGYGLQPENAKDKNTAFIIFKLSDKQREMVMQKAPKPKESNYFTTGKKISLFNTSDINGKKVRLNEKGKIIVLNFWFINCQPCRMEIPELNDLVESYKGNDSILFVSVALDKKWDLQDFLKQTSFNYAIVDDGKYIMDRYGIKSFPTHLIVDAEGKVYFHTSGLSMGTVYWLKKSIDELLNSFRSQNAAAR